MRVCVVKFSLNNHCATLIYAYYISTNSITGLPFERMAESESANIHEDMMHIVGGLYHEICLRPAWNGLFGSGGRAALTIAALSSETILHSYFEDFEHGALDLYRDNEVQLALKKSKSGVAFAYFHPLSRPHLEVNGPKEQELIKVEGDTVLRFGLVEGDAIVAAKRAILDPQGSMNAQDFHSNGSSAEELAIVLNENEIKTWADDLVPEEAAREIISAKQANVVVIKRGFQGATVVNESLEVHEIPAFKSPIVFKIGTGDVFSALFSLLWGERGINPVDAAYQASAGVAKYATTRRSPMRSVTNDFTAISGKPKGPVIVVGAKNTLGRHYAFEEAICRLSELGVDAQSDTDESGKDMPAVLLVLAEGMNELAVRTVLESHEGVAAVVLDELQSTGESQDYADKMLVSDFTTALYHAAWATLPQVELE